MLLVMCFLVAEGGCFPCCFVVWIVVIGLVLMLPDVSLLLYLEWVLILVVGRLLWVFGLTGRLFCVWGWLLNGWLRILWGFFRDAFGI